ncbi:DUF6464 family protein [Oscillatoria sp. CS-180]|uniref:DUF6464 family protein n=1 Tax=Oscillatoria sp. CS-180 TaxID=3021720 RepID=UPI00232B823C|nr:DUF6464 family protein [Oscillatoria sp. CS-180]MDB9528680.1 DUF6464 family protein [Oscillatoria sp. CS-180]
MPQNLPPTELILNHPRRSLGRLYLDGMPQPGSQVVFGDRAYTVLERRHRYQFQANRYHLHKIDLYVQATSQLNEKSQVGDRWVLGDASCRYNAHSELVRCAVNPEGPCSICDHYARRE